MIVPLPDREVVRTAFEALLDGNYDGYSILAAWWEDSGEECDEETGDVYDRMPLPEFFQHLAELASEHATIHGTPDPPDFALIAEEDRVRGERARAW